MALSNSGGPVALGSYLVGVELGRSRVTLAILDRDARRVVNVIERPIARGGGSRDPLDQELSTRAALDAALARLGLGEGQQLPAAVTIGFANCGVGSGPELRGWLEEMSEELREPIIFIGDRGISYAPCQCLDFVERVFAGSGLDLLVVELAPVAASRMLGSLPSGAMTLGSGVAWSARILHDQVLEAFENDGPFDEVVHVAANGIPRPLGALAGVEIDERLCRTRRVSAGALAPAVGAALSLLGPSETNLLYGEVTDGPVGPHGRQDLVSAVGQNVPDALVDDKALEYKAFQGHDSGTMHRDDTYQLQRLPEPRSQSPAPERSPPGASGERGSFSRSPVDDDPFNDPSSSGFDDLAGIEAFAHPEEPPPRSFNVTDFLLGALAMLAIVLVIWIVL